MTAISKKGVATYAALKDIRPQNAEQLRTITAVDAYDGTTRCDDGANDFPVLEGVGTLHSRLGYTFSGSLHAGQPCGHGVLRWADGRTVVGIFAGGTVDGSGTLQWPNGDVYTGALRRSVRNGSGRFIGDGGMSHYEGDWRNGMREGSGEQRYTNGSVYRGAWAANKRHGRGTLRYCSGDVYEGDWDSDVPSGHGVMGWVGAARLFYREVYTGQWLEGRPEGVGRSVYVASPQSNTNSAGSTAALPTTPLPVPSLFMAPPGSLLNVYVGEYCSGQRDGVGVFYYADGSCYEGRWSAGVKCGPGRFTSAVGEVREETHGGTAAATAAAAAAAGERDDSSAEAAASLAVVPTVSTSGLSSLLESEDDLQSVLHNLLHRYNTTLKFLFHHCCQLREDVALPSTLHDWWQQRLPGRVALVQCLALLHGARVLGAAFTIGDALHTAADVVRIETTSIEASPSADLPYSVVPADLSATTEAISRADGALNYRQFCEWLIRVAVHVATGPAAVTVAAKLRLLLEGPLSATTTAATTRAGVAFPSVAAVFLPHSLKRTVEVQHHRSSLVRCYAELQSVGSGDVGGATVSLRSCLTAMQRTLQRHHVTPSRVVAALTWLKDVTPAPHAVGDSVSPSPSLAQELRQSAMARNRAVQQADENTEAAQCFVEFTETVMTMADLVQAADGTTLETLLKEIQDGLFAE